MSDTLKQICRFQLQICLSMFHLLVDTGRGGVKKFYFLCKDGLYPVAIVNSDEQLFTSI